jgi:hypothetical protein
MKAYASTTERDVVAAPLAGIASASGPFLPLVEVASQIGTDATTLRRMVTRGEVFARPRVGGRGSEIDISTLPAKYRAKFATTAAVPVQLAANIHIPPVPSICPTARERNRVRAELRYEAVISHEKARAERRAGETLAVAERRWLHNFRRAHPEMSVSIRSVRSWRAKLIEAQGNIDALIDGNDGVKQSGSRIPQRAAQMFADQILRAHRPNLKLIYDNVIAVATVKGWGAMPSYHSFYRYAHRIPKLVRKLLRESADRPRSVLPYVVRDPSSLPAYDTIQADHRQIDVPVRCDKGCEVCSTTRRRKGKKPRGHFPLWTVYYDIRSRRVLGSELSIDTPTSRTVLAVFFRIVDEHGLPCRLYLDNGADFRKAFGKRLRRKGMQQWDGPSEEALRAQFVQLGVEVTYAIPYNAQAKPIERMLRTFRHQFDEDFEAYRGQHGEKSELARELLFRPSELPSISEMRYLLELQIEKYNATSHTGTGMDERSPDEVFFNPEMRLPRRIPNAAFAYLAYEPLKDGRVVGRNGVREQGRLYRLSSLRQHLNYYGEKVSVRINPNDQRMAMLFDWNTGQVICEAVASTEDATYDTRDAITRRIIERVYGDGKELMRMAREYVAGSRERLAEYRVAKLEYITQRSREIGANRVRLAAHVEGVAPVVVGQFSTPEQEFNLHTLEAILDEDDARERAQAAAEAARLCVVAPRREEIPSAPPKAKPRVPTRREIAQRLGCSYGSYNEYKRGATPWPCEEMRLESERLELLRDASSAEIEAVLAEPPRYQRAPIVHHTGDATLKAIAARLGRSESGLRKYRSGRLPWPAGLQEEYDKVCAELRQRGTPSVEPTKHLENGGLRLVSG